MKFVKDSDVPPVYNIIDNLNGNVCIGYIRRTLKGVWHLFLSFDCSVDIEEMEEILKKMKDLQ